MAQKILSVVISMLLIAAPGLVGFVSAQRPNVASNEKIIEEGLAEYNKLSKSYGRQNALKPLTDWFNRQPEVGSARLNGNDITVYFRDRTSVILLDLDIIAETLGSGLASATIGKPTEGTAIITDALEWQGWSPASIISPIIQDLTSAGYAVTYVKNEQADLRFIENNHNKGVIYHRGHGGVFEDINGNKIVVLQTGERWVDKDGDGKPDGHEYEYGQGWIFKGGISHGGTTYYFICYGPGLIENYYSNLPYSLVYMTSCDGTYNPTMANAYLGAGAGAYVGWNNPVTVNHGNNWAKEDFHMFCINSYTVQQVVDNTPRDSFPYFAKLTHYGDGSLTLI